MARWPPTTPALFWDYVQDTDPDLENDLDAGEKWWDTANAEGYVWNDTGWDGLSVADYVELAGTIPQADVSDDTIITRMIAASAVTATQIAADAVGNSEVAADAIDTEQVANAAITNALIAADAVTNSEIAADAVDTAQLANDAVDAARIAADAVTNTEIASDAVDTAQVANSAITTALMDTDAVTNTELANDSVDTAQLANDAVDAARIAAGAVGNTELASSAIWDTGTYTGDGIDGRTITHNLGRSPAIVIIAEFTSAGNFQRMYTIFPNETWIYCIGDNSGREINNPPNSTEFTVGNGIYTANDDGNTYRYVVVG